MIKDRKYIQSRWERKEIVGSSFARHIMQTTTTTIVEGNFNPKNEYEKQIFNATIGHGFTMDFWMKNWRRKEIKDRKDI